MGKLPKLTAEHILYGIAAANALRLGWAYASADAGGQILSVPGVVGAILGATVSIGTAFIAGKLGGKLTKARKAITWAAFVIVLILEPIILAPLTMTHMSEPMAQLLGPGFGWAWSVALALVPSLVLAGVAVANGSLVEAAAQQPQEASSGSLSEPQTRSRKSSGRSAKKKSAAAEVPCRYQCGQLFGSQNAANAHARSCAYRPTVLSLDELKKETTP